MDGNLNLLVVDDDKEITELLKIYFTKKGYHVYVANTGTDAIKILEEKKNISAVLLDIILPVISGIDILNNFPHLLQDIPIIIISGLSNIDTAVKALKSGADDYVVKPFRLGELEEKISEIMYKKAKELTHSKNLTAAKAMEMIDNIKGKKNTVRFCFENIDELNKFTKLIREREDVTITDIRIGEKYEVIIGFDG